MRKGFTLVEVIITMSLVAIIASFSALYIREGFSAWLFLGRQKRLVAVGRSALNRVVRELKTCDGTENLVTFEASELSFINIDAESITFSQSGTDLLRGSNVLQRGLQDPGGVSFTYLDKNGNVSAVRDDIRLVRCRLTFVQGGNRFVAESAAGIRNRSIQ